MLYDLMVPSDFRFYKKSINLLYPKLTQVQPLKQDLFATDHHGGIIKFLTFQF